MSLQNWVCNELNGAESEPWLMFQNVGNAVTSQQVNSSLEQGVGVVAVCVSVAWHAGFAHTACLPPSSASDLEKFLSCSLLSASPSHPHTFLLTP